MEEGAQSRGYITFQKSTTALLSATVYRKFAALADRGGAVVTCTNAFHSYNVCWYMHALNNNGNDHRHQIKMSQK